ncbi:unnamed protein product [Moneuplotes crassus]|uniref:Translin-associated factor X-interacting protein 1 N-terminal domain-containing protein n=1 Tax=Euplotes crassus TaxID=5936 RepID=A0AAD1XZE7_EUPCR|nr:unnamed protein product [Moneuplotes crassus]
MSGFYQLQNFKQLAKFNKLSGKVSSKGKVTSKRKSGKFKSISKGFEENNYKTSKNKGSNERQGLKIASRNTFLAKLADQHNNSSLEEYNMKGKMSAAKMIGHRRENTKNAHLSIGNYVPNLEDNSSSPIAKKPKYTRNKLKKYATNLGLGSSRNNASGGILANGSIPKTYKRSMKESQKVEEKKKLKSTLNYKSNRRLSNKSEIGLKGSNGQSSDFGFCQTTTAIDKFKMKSFEKPSKANMMFMSNNNHIMTVKNQRCQIEGIFNSGRKKGASNRKYINNYQGIASNDCNDLLSTTTDRIESNRTIKNRGGLNAESHRDIQERKALQKIQETLEREYKFYQVSIKTKDQSQEKVPEILLRDASNDTIKKLCKIYPQFSTILAQIGNCYNDCIDTAISDFEMKDQEIKKWRKEAMDLNKKIGEFIRQSDTKDQKIVDLSKEITKLKRQHRDSEIQVRRLEEYAQEMQSKAHSLFGRYDQEKVLTEIKQLIKENEDVKCIARELKSEIEYGKQRENKLMYFLFLMQQKNYPVFDIFEKHIKDLPTSRFSTNLDDKFKEIYIEQKKKMKEMGLIGDFDFACTARAQKLGKLDKQTEMSIFSEESFEPINGGPAPLVSKPLNVPALDFGLMNENLAKERMKTKNKENKKKKRKLGGSDPGRLSQSEHGSSLFKNMVDEIDHNKYGRNLEYFEDEEEYKQGMKNYPQNYDCRVNSDEESSPCSCSYCLRKEGSKGGLEELIKRNDLEPDSDESLSFHSSILHENKGDKYKNIREIRRLYEVMKDPEDA